MNIPTQFTDDSHYQNTIIKHSRRLVGYFNYGTDSQRMDFGSLQHRNKNGFADCSSLVWLVMKQAGYNVGQTAFSTPEMENDAKNAHQYFRQIHAKNVKPGDIVIVNVGTGYVQMATQQLLMVHITQKNANYRNRWNRSNGFGPSVNNCAIFSKLLKEGRITYARPTK